MSAPAALQAPRPGTALGLYPQRDAAAPQSPARARWRERIARPHAYRQLADEAAQAAERWQLMPDAGREAETAKLRARLGRAGLDRTAMVDALGCAAAALRRTLGIRLYTTQLYAAAVLLDGAAAEMATGEGKTYAAGAAAAAAALAGIPVHVFTANDYLVERDSKALAPWYAALGLSTGRILTRIEDAARRTEYRADIVYCTARELVFDYLRDGLEHPYRGRELMHRAARLSGECAAPRLRGLCMAILDEADSILLDEAVTPLVLSRGLPAPGQRAWLWQAFALARQLSEPEHFRCQPQTAAVELTEAGRERLAGLSSALGAEWRLRRRAEEVVRTALAAMHLYARERDYLVQEGRVVLIDSTTGRAAPGRAWSRGLQQLVELKEGVALSADTSTAAQITYQRFFPRYLRLAGMSGTLAEARRELAAIYGLDVVRVPLRTASRRRDLPARVVSEADRWPALVERIEALHRQGRPVLVGTESIGDSEALAARLAAAGIAHRVLNARQDRDEAAIIARAGEARAVTVATRMAGRGTDIALTLEALALGGLHVIDCQQDQPGRLARQLAGRCARQGEPGSCESWLWVTHAPADSPRTPRSILAAFVRHCAGEALAQAPQWLLRAWAAARQRREEQRRAAQRMMALQQDRAWARNAVFAATVE